MRRTSSICLLVLLLGSVSHLVLGTDAPDRARFRPDLAESTSDTFTFVVMADPQPRDTKNPAVTPKEFFDTIDEVNERAPAFSVICGDLIMGYTEDAKLVGEMWDSFLDATVALDQPAFCVIGNHDVWDEASESYVLERFGDVRWYSWDYGSAHFIVLDSDVVGQMNRIDGAQLEWLTADLEASRDKRFKFVFMHKPYQYFGTRWDDEIHPLLAKYGTTAVFGGHWHSHRKERTLDGITYYMLPAAGGIVSGEEFTGVFRGFMEVTVKGDEVSYALNRGGEILPDDYVTAEQVSAVDTLRRGQALTRIEMPPVDLTTGMNGTARIDVTNPTPYQIEYAIGLTLGDEGRVEPAARTLGALAPEARTTHTFRVTCPGFGETRPFPPAVVNVDYTLALKYQTGRLQSRTEVAPTFAMPDELPAPSLINRAVKLVGGATVRVPYDEALNVDGPFTFEAWIKCESFSYVGGAMSREENGGYGLFLGEERGLYTSPEGTPQLRFVVHAAKQPRAVEAKAEGDHLPVGRWCHIACTYDGETMSIWLDGRRVAQAAAPEQIAPNKMPMYLGADAGWTGDPWAFMKGEIDEFRLSSVCRYTKPFRPEERFTPDEDTLVLYHLDRVLVNRVVDYSGNALHGTLVGNASLVDRVETE